MTSARRLAEKQHAPCACAKCTTLAFSKNSRNATSRCIEPLWAFGGDASNFSRVFSCTKVMKIAKHRHICGRWPTSRQHRFGRYVQGPMPKVVGPQRIKRARSAREDSSIYIYIHTYIYILCIYIYIYIYI